ncbi:hypothetical protein IF1G_00637 [Cordyceps javanica]|uniref:Uncharacterized protein n=1 Tax=Cordyceps javanica TaxID=43265 RepID=A0A545VG62_9HYPO|nr:hypothetical protein IF1G_00637 [Cordyceps javanica]
MVQSQTGYHTFEWHVPTPTAVHERKKNRRDTRGVLFSFSTSSSPDQPKISPRNINKLGVRPSGTMSLHSSAKHSYIPILTGKGMAQLKKKKKETKRREEANIYLDYAITSSKQRLVIVLLLSLPEHGPSPKPASRPLPLAHCVHGRAAAILNKMWPGLHHQSRDLDGRSCYIRVAILTSGSTLHGREGPPCH